MSDEPLLIPVPVEDPLKLAWYECNDFGNGRRLVDLSKGLIKWVVDTRRWIAFDGKRWRDDEGFAESRARGVAHEVAQHIHDEAAALGELIGNPEKPNEVALKERFGEWCTAERAMDRLTMLHRHAVKSGNAAQTAGMLTQAKDMVALQVWSHDFDRDPLSYNVQNGTLRFRRSADGEWHVAFQEGHVPADMLKQIANVEYDPGATCPQWLERLELLHPDPDQRAILPILYGQSLTGLTDGEEFYTHQGQGGDGKSKTHGVLAALHGDYYSGGAVKTFLQASFQKSGSDHRSDLVRLAGDIRMLVVEEPGRNAMWDSEILKQVTGGGNITARGSGAKAEITFKPRWKLHVECNKLPAAPSDDRGWWRRQVIIPWACDISQLPGGAEPSAALEARLLTEKSGILNWLIAGCLEWLVVRRVPKVANMEAAVASARAGTSPIAEWLADACDLSDRSAREGATVLYNAFKDWCEAQGLDRIPSQRRFGDALTDRQIYVDKDRRGNKVRYGIRLRGSDPLIEAHRDVGDREPLQERPTEAAHEVGDLDRPYDPLGEEEGE